MTAKRFRFIAEFDCDSVTQALRVGAAFDKLLASASANGGLTTPESWIGGPLRADAGRLSNPASLAQATSVEWGFAWRYGGGKQWSVQWYSGEDAEDDARARFAYMTGEWRDSMRSAAEENERDGFTLSNQRWYDWNNPRTGVKYHSFAILRRYITPVEEIELFEGEPVV